MHCTVLRSGKNISMQLLARPEAVTAATAEKEVAGPLRQRRHVNVLEGL